MTQVNTASQGQEPVDDIIEKMEYLMHLILDSNDAILSINQWTEEINKDGNFPQVQMLTRVHTQETSNENLSGLIPEDNDENIPLHALSDYD